MTKRFACLCCGYLTLSEEPPGTYDICPVCWWEDDDVQARDPAFRSGANVVSLDDARKNFKSFGASDQRFVGEVRKPTDEEFPAAEPS
jgi:hypothetical protein